MTQILARVQRTSPNVVYVGDLLGPKASIRVVAVTPSGVVGCHEKTGKQINLTYGCGIAMER